MSNKQVTYYNHTIGAKVKVTEEGKAFTDRMYGKKILEDVIYGVIKDSEGWDTLIVDWYNHKGMRVVDGWYIKMEHLEYYEDN